MFKEKEFMKTKFAHREEGVPVPALAQFFDEGEDPVFVVRGLSASELALANEASSRNKVMENFATALTKGDADQIKAIRDAIGLGEQVPNEIAKRIEMLTIGSVNPKLPQNFVVKLAEEFTIEFMVLTNKITELTGMGSVMVKPKPSGRTRK